jgi:GTP-binding protein
VLSKALELGHKVIVVVNKIDRPDQRIHEVMDEVLELLLDLNATDEQFESPTLFCSGRQGTASYSPDHPGTDLVPLFETILDYIPAPDCDPEAPFQMLVSSIDYNEFVGRIAVGRIERGTVKQNQEIVVCNYHKQDEPPKKAKATALYTFDGLARTPVTEARAGEIIAMSGIGDITIGDTVCATASPEPIEFVKISAPTLEMTFSVNDSPFAGREGKYVTSRQLRDRLFRETLKDVSLRVTEMENYTDAFNVAGARCPCPSSSRPCAGRATSSRSRPPVWCTRRWRAKSANPSSGWSSTCPPTAWGPSWRSWAAGRASSCPWTPSAAAPSWSSWCPPGACSATATSF